ncbi:STAS domain-containing protein [Streptomyces sp. NPDC001076]
MANWTRNPQHHWSAPWPRPERPGPDGSFVDLSEVTFSDSSILSALCEAWSDCRARRGWVRIVYENHTTDLVFRHTGLLDRFPAYANAQDAWEGRRPTPHSASPSSASPAAEARCPAEGHMPRRTTRQDTS